MRKRTVVYRVAVLVVTLWSALAGAPLATADSVLYVYEGNPFRNFFGEPPDPLPSRLTATVTLDAVLPANCVFCRPTPLQIEMKDGLSTIIWPSVNQELFGPTFATDSTGRITEWRLTIVDHGPPRSIMGTQHDMEFTVDSTTFRPEQPGWYVARITDAPGDWFGPFASVPEPPDSIPFGVAVAGVLGAGWWKRRRRARSAGGR